MKSGLLAETPDIRPETAADIHSIRAVHRAAFPGDEEARLVDGIRASGNARVSLVAEIGERVVGHVLFSPVRIDGSIEAVGGVGLAPVAVLPEFQRRGIGSALVRAGIDACRTLGCDFVVVLGHPDFYPRFGFERASARGLANEYGADEAFLVLELRAGALPQTGLVRYGEEFGLFGAE